MNKRILAALLFFPSLLYAGAWPTDNITTTNLDAATDDPSQARTEIYNAMIKLKDVIGARSSASGVAPLDASALLPTANLPVIPVANLPTVPVTSGGTGATAASTARSNLGAAASGANSDITSLTGITGAVSSTRACDAGFTRITPNYCQATTYGGVTTLTPDTCTTISAPTNAKLVVLRVDVKVRSANSAGVGRYSWVASYTTSGCTTFEDQAYHYEHEFNATGAGVIIGSQTDYIYAHPHSGSIYLKQGRDAGAQGTGGYDIQGYFD